MSTRAAVFIRTAAWDMHIFIWICPAKSLAFFLERSWFDWWHHSDIFTASFSPDLAVEAHRKHQTKNLENKNIAGITWQFWKSQDISDAQWEYFVCKCLGFTCRLNLLWRRLFLMWLLQNRRMKSVYFIGKTASTMEKFPLFRSWIISVHEDPCTSVFRMQLLAVMEHQLQRS